MERIRMKLLTIFILIFVVLGLEGQNMMFVKEKSGNQSIIVINTFNNITFDSGNMNINNKNGSKNSFGLNQIQNFNFSGFTDLADIKKSELCLNVYPNPTIDRIILDYYVNTSGKAQIEIIDIQGKVMYIQNLINVAGTNQIRISVSTYQNGIYLCRLHLGSRLRTSKFIKN